MLGCNDKNATAIKPVVTFGGENFSCQVRNGQLGNPTYYDCYNQEKSKHTFNLISYSCDPNLETASAAVPSDFYGTAIVLNNESDEPNDDEDNQDDDDDDSSSTDGVYGEGVSPSGNHTSGPGRKRRNLRSRHGKKMQF